MPICKFFVRGHCKFGERCFNEHPRNSSRRQEWDEWEDERQQGWGSPMTKGQNYSEGRNFNEYPSHSTRRQEKDEWNYERQSQWSSPMSRGQNYNENRNFRERSYQTSNRSNERGHHQQDQYHWSKESNSNNRFAALAEAKNSDTDQGVILTTIKNDMKLWAESKMWPFSCYSYSKDTSCIDGLPDISPEELRVLWSLHSSEYRSILNEIEGVYSRAKDELFEMSDATKSNLVSQIKVPTNPSKDLKISILYGPDFNFKSKSQVAETAPYPATPAPDLFKTKTKAISQSQTTPNIFMQNNGPESVAFQSPPGLAISPSVMPAKTTTTTAVSPQNVSIFGTATTQASTSASDRNYEIYTPHDCLTEEEKKKFEAEKFAIGEIPTRPPSEQYCR